MTRSSKNNKGFTLIELITIILLLGVLSVVATAKWPGDMKEDAAVREFKRAIRYAQHQAMTREYISLDAWGLMVNADNSYSILRQVTPVNIPDFTNRFLLGDNAITINDATGGDGLWFNGLGEPISSAGAAIGPLTYTVAGSEDLTVCAQTGFVAEGNACP